MTTPAALVRSLRPRQWTKNLLVFGAPAAAAVVDEWGPLLDTAATFVAFCAAASAMYLINDVLDVAVDRQHPTKQHRPIAAGAVQPRVAVAVAVVLAASGLAVAAVVRPGLAGLLAGYVGLALTYSLWWKHVAVVDLVAVAAGFLLRAVAGAVAVDVPVSNWFFSVAAFGSLLVVAGKRSGELAELGADAGRARRTLPEYSESYLQSVRMMAAGVVLVAYSLWAFERAAAAGRDLPLFQLSIAPFLVAILRFCLLADRGEGSAPEDLVFRDRVLQVAGAVWLLTFAVAQRW